MSAPPLLEVDRASRTFRVASTFSAARDVPALREVSFRLEAGKALALVGESGSGKTTCGRAIAGLVALSAGRILLHGRDISARQRGRARRHSSNGSPGISCGGSMPAPPTSEIEPASIRSG